MSKTNKPFTNTAGGEVSPFMYGRLDLPLYGKALAKCENFFIQPTGGARYRPGTNFVHFTRRMQDAVFIPFQFNAQQAYLIEATPGFFRFYNTSGVITGNDMLITAMTNANPGVFTVATAHNLVVGDAITLRGMTGTNIVDGTPFTINTVPTGTSFTLKTVPGAAVFDTTSVGTLVPNGFATYVWNVTAMTAANPAVITIPNHLFAVGDELFFTGMQGDTSLNGKFFIIATVVGSGATAGVTLTDLFGNSISTLGDPAYTSGGVVSRVYEITTPYKAADLPYLQFSQNANTVYIVNQNYAPMKLVRLANANWTIATFTRSGSDPFTGAGNFPACVCFDGNGRLLYGSTATNPQTIWGSSAPTAGGPQYDDFTFGTAATNAVQFTLGSTASGRADSIQWIGATEQFSVIGTFGTVRTLYGSAPGQPISPTAISAQSIGNFGAAFTLPLALGYSVFYIQRANQILRSIEYDIYISNYNTTNRNLVSEHLTYNGLRQITLQQGVPDVVFASLGDGRFLSLTVQAQENVSGWARHFTGGSFLNAQGSSVPHGNVRWMSAISRVSLTDQLWFIVQRRINNQTVYAVEYLTDFPIYPQRHDFYTGNKAIDDQAFENAMFEIQKYACHADMSLAYIGTSTGLNANASMTPGTGATVAGTTNVVFTAAPGVFDTTMGGRQIWEAYDALGNGGGRALISGVISSTQVACTILSPFTNLNAIPAGSWLLTASLISGLDYLNGETVSVICDGGPDISQVVVNGQIQTTSQASVIFVGYGYTGTLEWLNLDTGGETGTAENKARNVNKIGFNFYCSLGVNFGTSPYALDTINFKKWDKDQLDRPTVPFTGVRTVRYTDKWSKPNSLSEGNKRVIIIQNQPLPCNVLSIDVFVNTSDDPN